MLLGKSFSSITVHEGIALNYVELSEDAVVQQNVRLSELAITDGGLHTSLVIAQACRHQYDQEGSIRDRDVKQCSGIVLYRCEKERPCEPVSQP